LKQQETQNAEAKSSSLAEAPGDEPSDDKNRAALRKRMANVFAKLDALCNFSYTPRAVCTLLDYFPNDYSISNILLYSLNLMSRLSAICPQS
jgi:hypothetical protein